MVTSDTPPRLAQAVSIEPPRAIAQKSKPHATRKILKLKAEQ
jgi:hypothetical protein